MNFLSYLSGSSGSSEASTNQADSVNEAIHKSFLAKLNAESEEAGGPFLYSEKGSMQEYLREVEDGVLLYLVLAKFDLVRAATVFQELTIGLLNEGFSFQLTSLVYSNTPVNKIRSAIRIFFVKSPNSMFRLIDNSLQVLGQELGQPSITTKKIMIEKGRNLKAQLQGSPPFMLLPLIDDCMSSVVHMNVNQLQRLIKPTSSTGPAFIPLICIRISHCGSAQVNGDYILTAGANEFEIIPGTTETDMCFTNAQGFQLCRSDRQLLNGHQKGLGGGIDTMKHTVYDWYILNPVLSSSYYSCTTAYSTSLPPMTGWRAMHNGKLPGPHLELLEVDQLREARAVQETQTAPLLTNLHFPNVDSSSSSLLNDKSLISLSTRVRDRIDHRRGQVDNSDSQSRTIVTVSKAGLSVVEAVERISKLRKGLAKNIINNSESSDLTEKDGLYGLRSRLLSSIDSTYKYGVLKYSEPSSSSTPMKLELNDDDEFKLNLDDLKHTFDEAVKSTQTGEIIHKCIRRRNMFEIQLKELSNRLKSLDTDDVDNLLSTSPSWSSNPNGSLTDCKLIGMSEEEMLRLEQSWNLDVLITSHVPPPSSTIGDLLGLTSIAKTAKTLKQSLLRGSIEEQIPDATQTSQQHTSLFPDVKIVSVDKVTIKEKIRMDRFRIGTGKSSIPLRLQEQKQSNSDSFISKSLQEFAEKYQNDERERASRQGTQVSILGAEMWPPKIHSYSTFEEKPHYVIRVVLNDMRILQPPTTQHVKPSTVKGFQQFAENFTLNIAARAGLDSRHAFTVRRDLPSICLLHTELDRLLKELLIYEVQIFIPPFPDAFSIGVIEESFAADCNVSQLTDPAKFLGGQPFMYNAEPIVSMTSKDGGTSLRMKSCISSLESYLQGVFSLMENIDSHYAEISSDEFFASAMLNDDEIVRGEAISGGEREIALNAWRANRIKGLENFLTSLGQLIGRFLQAAELQDILELRKSTDTVASSSSSPEIQSEAESSQINAILPSCRPCWYPYATEGLRLQLQTRDEQGGRLSLRGEDELLRRQKFKCLGCGEPLQSLFFGLDQNYLPCRYTGGLFCRRWCHSNDHRVIPHRLLLYWDTVPHRTCQQVTKFLDEIWQNPVLNIKDVNGLLYEGIPALTLTRNLRDRAASVLETMCEINITQALDICTYYLGSQLHLCVSNEYYSLNDLVGISNGATTKLLKLYTKKLTAISPNSVNGGELEESYLDKNQSLVASVGKFIQNISDSFL